MVIQYLMKNQELETQLNSMYNEVNKLLLWKTSLKVKINEKIPDLSLAGICGYISDLNSDGFLVWDKDNNNFYRIPADYLDVVEWDMVQFNNVLKNS
jgi:hypothetical protein